MTQRAGIMFVITQTNLGKRSGFAGKEGPLIWTIQFPRITSGTSPHQAKLGSCPPAKVSEHNFLRCKLSASWDYGCHRLSKENSARKILQVRHLRKSVTIHPLQDAHSDSNCECEKRSAHSLIIQAFWTESPLITGNRCGLLNSRIQRKEKFHKL